MQYDEIHIGQTVSFQGTAFKVAALNVNGGDFIRIYPVRRSNLYRRAIVTTADMISHYAPKPKISAHAKTCQICGRLIHAATGKIAHHGYERPGHGWQTASCWGARHVPFEVSRDELGNFMRHLINSLTYDRHLLTQLRTETKLVIMREAKTDSIGRLVLENGKRVYHDVEYRPGDAGYPKALAIKIAEVEQSYSHTRSHYRFQWQRYTTWKPAN